MRRDETSSGKMIWVGHVPFSPVFSLLFWLFLFDSVLFADFTPSLEGILYENFSFQTSKF
jgi:hypothetical protein